MNAASPDTTLLAVNVGNTSIQWGLFRGGGADVPLPQSTHHSPAAGVDFAELDRWLPQKLQAAAVASVNRPGCERVVAWLADHRPHCAVRQLANADALIALDVEAPERVGADRVMAAVAAARLKRPDHAAIVVDAGTAITVDLVSADGVFRGGAILPGLMLAAGALSRNTDQLPLVNVSADNPPAVVGRWTEAALSSGLYWGTVGALRELTTRMIDAAGQPVEIFFSGGDAIKLAPLIVGQPRLEPDLVLSGIALTVRES